MNWRSICGTDSYQSGVHVLSKQKQQTNNAVDSGKGETDPLMHSFEFSIVSTVTICTVTCVSDVHFKQITKHGHSTYSIWHSGTIFPHLDLLYRLWSHLGRHVRALRCVPGCPGFQGVHTHNLDPFQTFPALQSGPPLGGVRKNTCQRT